ncbi:hypothetical protein EIB18_03940 [Caulobacter vibrioides]|nr:hypothetical protein CA608_03695 [Caulobacter vibrioides]AZH11947.1 hypothetical protein EIB18_03940 [Caulobacter vibrioides]PLR11711.1 hypothetical protein CVUC_09865 [Caulobacter vibrioides]
MTQTTSETWCARIQAKLMAAIDAAWAMIEASDDPAVLRKARDRVKACGEMAANVRKIAAMSGQRKPAPRTPGGSAPDAALSAVATAAPGSDSGSVRGLDRLRGGGRGRL